MKTYDRFCNCSPPLAKISDFSGRFEQARQHSGNNGESNREQNEPVEMVRYVKVRKREPRRDFDKGVSNYRIHTFVIAVADLAQCRFGNHVVFSYMYFRKELSPPA